MSLEKFIEELKANNVVEAYQIIKTSLNERSETLKEEKRFEVAAQYNLARVVEAKGDDEKEEPEMSDEEKEAAKAKEEKEKAE